MSLIKSPAMTEGKLAANQRNGKLSQGPTTEEGKARIGAAQLRHGLYAGAQVANAEVWGEDPAEWEDLLDGLWEEFRPVGVLAERMVLRLAQALWQMERLERRQQGDALRRSQGAGRGRDNRLHARMMRLKMTAQALRNLAHAVAEWHYVTVKEHLDVVKKLHHDGALGEIGEIAVDFFSQLQEPGTDEAGISKEERDRRMVNSFRSIFGLSAIDEPITMLGPDGKPLVVRPKGWVGPNTPAEAEGDDSEHDDRYPTISAEDWKLRERARKLLKNILARQVENCESERKDLLRASLAGMSPCELAAENAPSHAEVLLLRRVQDANMREVRRLTNLLLKLKREERPGRAGAESGDTHDVTENTAVIGKATICQASQPLENETLGEPDGSPQENRGGN